MAPERRTPDYIQYFPAFSRSTTERPYLSPQQAVGADQTLTAMRAESVPKTIALRLVMMTGPTQTSCRREFEALQALRKVCSVKLLTFVSRLTVCAAIVRQDVALRTVVPSPLNTRNAR